MIKRLPILAAALSIALLLSSLIQTNKVSAAEGESIVMSPAAERLQLDAGQTVKKSLKIINDGTVAYDFKVYATPYSVESNTYYPNYSEKVSNADVYQWVKFDKNIYTLQPGASIDVPYTLVVPGDAAPGGHYGVIFAETQGKGDGGGQVIRNKRVGSVIYSTVNGQYKLEGKQVSAKLDWLQLNSHITAKTSVENTGNTDFLMTDHIRIKNILGGTVFEKKNERIVLPKTTRDSTLEWENGPTLGIYNVSVDTKVLDKTSVTSSWVLVLPTWLLIVVLAGLVAAGFWAVRRKR